MSFDELEKQFNMEAKPETKIVKTATIAEEHKKNDLDKDYGIVRENLKELIQKGSLAIDGILNLANETEQPRAYEVLAQLIKTVADTNKDLLNMHNQMKTIKGDQAVAPSVGQITTNNSIFVGSTTDLQKLLKGKLKEIEKLEHDGDIIDVEQ
jgi:hypothetical protein